MTHGVAVQLGGVHIIESLRHGDRKTGQRLSEIVTPLADSSEPKLPLHYWSESTRAGLLERLEHIAADVRLSGRAPIIQIETHGDRTGLQVTSGEIVPWSELKEPFTTVNVTCRLNLLILLGACDGADLVKIVQPTDRAPAWALIGPLRPVTDREIEDAHAAFYKTLFTTKDVRVAWLAMNSAVQAPNSPFHCFRAEEMFREIFRTYFQEHCTPERLAQRVDHLSMLAQQQGLPPKEGELRERLKDQRPFFDRARRDFFMIDLCPENDARFPLSFEECTRGTGAAV